MSMPLMARAALVLLIAFSLSACAPSPEASIEPSAATTEAIAALDERLDDLAADLLAERDDSDKLTDRLDALGAKFERTLERLRESLDGIRTGSGEARDSAASAIANAQAVASDLSVLEERYDYHLRRYHGGGG